MGLKIDANKAVQLSGYNGKFKSSLKDIIVWGSKDPKITDVRELAYILATAKIESGYSLSRWESDFVCNSYGKAYLVKPCQKALDYYRSTNGKKDYYTLGVDPNGLPYFGRGLIQLTGKPNYIVYGNILGIPLAQKPDLALKPRNSYNIAVAYMIRRGTFEDVLKGDLYGARRTLGSGGKTNEVTDAYKGWVNILNDSKKTSLFSFGKADAPASGKQNNILPIGIAVSVMAVILITAIFVSKKKKS